MSIARRSAGPRAVAPGAAPSGPLGPFTLVRFEREGLGVEDELALRADHRGDPAGVPGHLAAAGAAVRLTHRSRAILLGPTVTRGARFRTAIARSSTGPESGACRARPPRPRLRRRRRPAPPAPPRGGPPGCGTAGGGRSRALPRERRRSTPGRR